MKYLQHIVQFLPLTVFLYISRKYGFANETWEVAFISSALLGILQLIILMWLVGSRLNRLIAGVNLFLVTGGIAFYFDITFLKNIMGYLQEAGIVFFVGVVSFLSILFTPTGIFEDKVSANNREKEFSWYFFTGLIIVFAWAFYFRGNILVAGAIPFVTLIVCKATLKNKIRSL